MISSRDKCMKEMKHVNGIGSNQDRGGRWVASLIMLAVGKRSPE